jgi:hypothetical protein
MDENTTALTQDAIDALLSTPKDEAQTADAAMTVPPVATQAPAAPSAVPVQPAVPTTITINAPPPPDATPPPGVVHASQPQASVPALDEERAAAIATEAAVAAVSPLQSSLSSLSNRMKALETALKKIESLEKEIARLKAQKPQGEVVTVETVRPLAERVVKLEKAAKNSPVFNIYEKFTCASCGSQGAAQVRTRCGACGKEGWLGRSKAA